MLTAFTNLGPQASSQRIRLHEWVRRTATPCDVWDYLGTASSSPRELLHRPVELLAAEARLRIRSRRRLDLVLLVREASPLSRGQLEERLLRSASFASYDFDDALYSDDGAGSLYRRLAPKSRKVRLAVAAADQVIAGNVILADWASGYNRSVTIIPTCVDRTDYDQKDDYAVGDPPRLVWIGSPNNEQYLELIARPLLEIHNRTGARLTLISGAHATPLTTLERIVDRVSWSLDTQRALLCRFDVGLMPLPDRPFEVGKCGYKLLQYAAAGLPCTGSPVGANRQILSALGMPAPDTPEDWLNVLCDLLSLSAESRRERARSASAVIEAQWSYQAWSRRWQDAVLGQSPAQATE